MAREGAGRPTVMTPEVISKLEDGFLKDLTDTEACLYAGISPASFYRYIEDNPKFGERKEELKENLRMHAKMNLADSIIEKQNGSDGKRLLEKKGDEYNPTRKADLTTGGDKINLGGILQDIWDENEK